MRLSDAMALGRTMKQPGNAASYVTCALGVGMAAFGCSFHFSADAYDEAMRRFPWIDKADVTSDLPPSPYGPRRYVNTISDWYWEVTYGKMTFDQLIDNVRAIEPPDPSEVTNMHHVTQVQEVVKV